MRRPRIDKNYTNVERDPYLEGIMNRNKSSEVEQTRIKRKLKEEQLDKHRLFHFKKENGQRAYFGPGQYTFDLPDHRRVSLHVTKRTLDSSIFKTSAKKTLQGIIVKPRISGIELIPALMSEIENGEKRTSFIVGNPRDVDVRYYVKINVSDTTAGWAKIIANQGEKVFADIGKPVKLPNIEDVFTAFQAFNAKAVNIRMGSLRNPKEWQAQMETARNELKATLDKMGIGQYIDWSVPEEDNDKPRGKRKNKAAS